MERSLLAVKVAVEEEDEEDDLWDLLGRADD